MSLSRRSFVLGATSTAVLCALGIGGRLGAVSLVRPPGGQDGSTLISKCIHCSKCIAACPRDLLIASRIEDGLANMRTPHMSFSDTYPGDLDNLKFCDACAEDNGGLPLCVAACPSSALHIEDGVAASSIIIGTADIDTDLCMAYRSSYCSLCYDACVIARGEGNEAIYFVDGGNAENGSTALPVVDADRCNGCGACESVCISSQAGSVKNTSQRAIVVEPVTEGEITS